MINEYISLIKWNGIINISLFLKMGIFNFYYIHFIRRVVPKISILNVNHVIEKILVLIFLWKMEKGMLQYVKIIL